MGYSDIMSELQDNLAWHNLNFAKWNSSELENQNETENSDMHMYNCVNEK